MYSVSQIKSAIATTKCCIGDFSCRLLTKGINGQEYGATMLFTMELSLLLFSLETYILMYDSTCLEHDEIEKTIHRINKLCNCDCITNILGIATGLHTEADHTILTHTE